MQEIQAKIKKFCKENNLESPPEYRLLDLMSELGEVSHEVLRTSNYGKKPIIPTKEIESELGDVFYSLITVANHFNVDLEKALEIVLEKYKERLKKGHTSSENK